MSLRNKRQQNFVLENVDEMQFGNVVKPYFTEKKEQKVIYPKDPLHLIRDMIKGVVMKRDQWEQDWQDISKYHIDSTLLNQSQYGDHRHLMTQLGLLNQSVQIMQNSKSDQTQS